jgi:segregation and condensation protein A
MNLIEELDKLLEEIKLNKDKILTLQMANIIIHATNNIKEMNLESLSFLIKKIVELLYIKSQRLLNLAGIEISGLEENNKVTEESIKEQDSLLYQYIKECKFYKDLADALKNRLEVANKLYSRNSKELAYSEDFNALALAEAFFRLFDKNSSWQEKTTFECKIDKITIIQKMKELKNLISLKEKTSIFEILKDNKSKLEIIILILALLELVKLGKIKIYQELPFEDIWIIRR